MDVVNVQVARILRKKKSNELTGGWHTEAALALLPGWDACLACNIHAGYLKLRSMAKNAKDWAIKNKLNRTSEVHGKEEYRIASFEGFSHLDEEVQETTATANIDIQDLLGFVSALNLQIFAGWFWYPLWRRHRDYR